MEWTLVVMAGTGHCAHKQDERGEGGEANQLFFSGGVEDTGRNLGRNNDPLAVESSGFFP